jgi:hypothetical protein
LGKRTAPPATTPENARGASDRSGSHQSPPSREADATLRRAAGRVKGAEPRRTGSTGSIGNNQAGRGMQLFRS